LACYKPYLKRFYILPRPLKSCGYRVELIVGLTHSLVVERS